MNTLYKKNELTFSLLWIGFLFTVIFYRTGSLLPCIIAHGLTNSLSAFAVSGSIAFGIVVSIFLIVVSVSFGIIIYRKGN